MRLRPFAAAAVLFAATLPAVAQQSINLWNLQPDFTTWSLFGSATARNDTPGNGFTYGTLTLTQDGTGDQAGAAFAPTPLDFGLDLPFHFGFNFFIPASGGIRGDGLTFTIATTPGVGIGGSGLGYQDIGPSVAFAIDTFHFGGDPVSPSLQILAGGSTDPLAATETGLGDDIRDPNFQWYASVDYLPSGRDDQTGTLTGSIWRPDLGSFSVQADIDFNALGLTEGPLYWGFTASNGVATDGHLVTWGAPLPVPEPASALLMLAGAMVLGGARRWHQAGRG